MPDTCNGSNRVACASCGEPLPPGTRAKINADGVIVCLECAEALTYG